MTRVASALLAACVVACGLGDEPQRQSTSHAPPAASGSVSVSAREPLLPTYPCSRCHADRAPDPTERALSQFHTQKVLHHGELGGWCYRCHTRDDVDQLHLADGTKVTFNEAYELCGSCHGDKLRDWKAGIHGLTTGFWLGARTRRSCPACHDPHEPRFAPMKPEHPPALPRTVSPSDRAMQTEEQHAER